jgi:hypothetical protein
VRLRLHLRSRHQIHAPCAMRNPFLQKLSLNRCTSIMKFTDTSVTGAGRSNFTLCFACQDKLFFSNPGKTGYM